MILSDGTGQVLISVVTMVGSLGATAIAGYTAIALQKVKQQNAVQQRTLDTVKETGDDTHKLVNGLNAIRERKMVEQTDTIVELETRLRTVPEGPAA